MDYLKELEAYRREEIRIYRSLNLEDINILMNMMEDARRQHKRIFICGNGGSAATASHYVCDFMKGVSLHQEDRYDFECLNDNTPLFSALANDISYEEVFVMPLRAKLREGDLLIGISGSGNSMNVIKALNYAKEKGAHTAALVGYDGGKMLHIAEHCIHVNINNMQIVEDLHMIFDHMMMYVLAARNQ